MESESARLSTLGVLNFIDQRDKDLVFGYIRQQCTECPEPVNILCIWFYFRLYHVLMDLKEDLLSAVLKYETPSAIQQRIIMPIIETCPTQKCDIMITVKSRRERIASFCVAALQLIDSSKADKCQIFIFAQSRESVESIEKIIESLGMYMGNDYDIKKQIFVATPQPVADIWNKLFNLKLVILEDAEVLLSNKFNDTVYDTFQYFPSEVQVIVSSATITNKISKLTNRFLRNPVLITDEEPQN